MVLLLLNESLSHFADRGSQEQRAVKERESQKLVQQPQLTYLLWWCRPLLNQWSRSTYAHRQKWLLPWRVVLSNGL